MTVAADPARVEEEEGEEKDDGEEDHDEEERAALDLEVVVVESGEVPVECLRVLGRRLHRERPNGYVGMGFRRWSGAGGGGRLRPIWRRRRHCEGPHTPHEL